MMRGEREKRKQAFLLLLLQPTHLTFLDLVIRERLDQGTHIHHFMTEIRSYQS